MIEYIIADVDLNVTIYYMYAVYSDIVRYYDISNPLHGHECVKNHYTLAIF